MKSAALCLFALALIAVAQGAAAPSVKDKVAAVAKKCAADSKVSAAQARIAFNQDSPKSENERCYLECVYRGVGVVKDNKFDAEGSKKLAAVRFSGANEKSAANKLIDTCNKEVSASSEKCALGRAVRECFVKNGKTVNFFPSAA